MKAHHVVSAATLALVLVMSGAAVASADTPAGGIAPGDSYVALGSSYAANGSTAGDFLCGRSPDNYAHLVAADLGLTLTDATCSGATIDNIFDTPQVHYTGARIAPQIDAVQPGTDLVTVTIGGNDVSYVSTLFRRSCAADRSPFDALAAPPALRTAIEGALCSGTVDSAAIQTALDGLTDELTNMVEAIRVRAPHARIVFVDYLTVLPQSGKSCVGVPLAKDDQKYILDIARQLQLATKHAAQRTGTELVELSKASRSHDACSDDPWVKGWDVSGTVTGNAGPYHPNAEGVLAAAGLLTEQLSSGRSSD